MAENTTHTSNDTNFLNELEFKGYQELLRESLLTDATGAMYTVNEMLDSVHRGNAYGVNAKGTITTGANVYMLGKTGAKEIHFDRLTLNASKGLLSINLYETPTITTDGSLVPILNRNRTSANTASMSVYTGSTISANGTLLENVDIYATVGSGAHISQGEGGITAGWVLAPNTNYLFVITNNDIDSTDYTAHFSWSERDVI